MLPDPALLNHIYLILSKGGNMIGKDPEEKLETPWLKARRLDGRHRGHRQSPDLCNMHIISAQQRNIVVTAYVCGINIIFR